ncbi:pentatricopeptide repeat-containing protein At3g60050-like [Nymphaea colorata]|uniref:pentatricopeptide repeat-containing protein At3g60050-like n=1 Tax=Nymphaea colorata TaxID=210225 RepID=UPI00129DBD2B|nr:pentatricopeptide repeat-containing protein At3g60050-like [Nymphaea colorata]
MRFCSHHRLLRSIFRSTSWCLASRSIGNGRILGYGEKESGADDRRGSKSLGGSELSNEKSKKSDFDHCSSEKSDANERIQEYQYGEAEGIPEGGPRRRHPDDHRQINKKSSDEYVRKLRWEEGSGEEFDIEETFAGFPLPGEDFVRIEGSEDPSSNNHDDCSADESFSARRSKVASKIFAILQQDGAGFDARTALDEMQIRVSGRLVREVLIRISSSINGANKSRCAKLAYKFFVWCDLKDEFRHSSTTYNMVMKIFADCDELKAMWKLVDQMTENGVATTARTFNILVCACGEAGMARKLVERFVKSKAFNYRPFKHSFNAILYSLLTVHQYKLIEWVYQQMLLDGHGPDVLTYNVMLCAKYRLGKLDQFHALLDEMGRNGFSPDLHTYNILLHVLGKGDKPLAALNLLNYMEDVGCQPRVLHFTNLIDGLSRAGNLDACKYFFDEMPKKGCEPDVVCYTVMITGFVVAGELQKAQKLFDEMLVRGHLPNVFTYNSMIRGLCSAGKFGEARSVLGQMESRGCDPNFVVYSTLVRKLQNAGKFAEANNVVGQMVEKGRYAHLVSKFKGYKMK